jgi:hypothetical protein
MSDRGGRILVAGAPRSGTTWVANVLAAAPAASLSVEPDNEKTSLLARVWKDGLPRFPVLDPGVPNRGYERLWRYAFDGRLGPFLSRSWLTRALLLGGGWTESGIAAKPVAVPGTQTPEPAGAHAPTAPRSVAPGGVRIVKTVHAVLCLDWVCDVADPDQVVIVERHPLAVIDSWRRLGMPDAERLWTAGRDWLSACGRLPDELDGGDAVTRMALQAGLMFRVLEDFRAPGRGVVRVSHESLCRDPEAGYRTLFERLGLPWSDAAGEALAASNREGQGYRPVRVAEREVGKWQGRFTASERERIAATLAAFGVSAD